MGHPNGKDNRDIQKSFAQFRRTFGDGWGPERRSFAAANDTPGSNPPCHGFTVSRMGTRCGLLVGAGVGDEGGGLGVVGEAPGGEVGELEDLLHLGEVDLFYGVRDVMVVGVEAGEPPEGGDIFEDERELV